MPARLRCLVVLLVFLMVPVVPCQGLHEKTGKLRLLLTGRVYEGRVFSSWFKYEPTFSSILIPSRESSAAVIPDDQMKRFVRIYFPRDYEGVQIQDFMLFDGTRMAMFSPVQQRWMHDAVLEGTGGLNTRSMLSAVYFPDWASSPIQEAFPNDVEALLPLGTRWSRTSRDGLIIFEEGAGLPPVFTMFKDKKVPWYFSGRNCALVVPRPGVVVWSWVKGPFADKATVKPGCTPHTISWQYGEGITWTQHDTIGWYEDPVENPYGLDMVMNMILYSAGRQLPGDVELVHDLRSRIVNFNSMMVLLLGTIEFAEDFGANMASMFDVMDEVIGSKKEADEMYLEQEYEQAWSAYGQCIRDLQDLNDLAVEMKNRALIWVYLVQWLIISATMLVAGFFLWSVMIQRRLYREVATTSLGRRETQ